MSVSQLLLGPVTYFGHILDHSHAPSWHSCGSLQSSMVWNHFSILISAPPTRCLLHMDSITPQEPPSAAYSIQNGHFQSLNPKASPLPPFCHYSSLLLHCYLLMPSAPIPGLHCPPQPDVVSGGLLSHQESQRSIQDILGQFIGIESTRIDGQYFVILSGLLLYTVEMW